MTGSTLEIHESLQHRGYSTSKRSVERDLVSLNGLLPETLINNNDAALALTREMFMKKMAASIRTKLMKVYP